MDSINLNKTDDISINFNQEHLIKLTEEQKELLYSSKKRRARRSEFLNIIIESDSKDLVNAEAQKEINNNHIKIKKLEEEVEFYKQECLKLIEASKVAEKNQPVFRINFKKEDDTDNMITYNECNDTMYNTTTKRKQVRNSSKYEAYKKKLWQHFDSNKEVLLNSIVDLKAEHKYIKIKMAFHVNNMNKDTDNVEKPFLDTLFNWLNHQRKLEGGANKYSDNQILTKESIITSSTRKRITQTVHEDEMIFFQIIPLIEEVEDVKDDLLFRYVNYINNMENNNE